MKYVVLFFLFCTFSLNAEANKPCTECSGDKNFIYKNELDAKVLQAIKDEFIANKVIFDIPEKMQKEFETKKQFIINNFMQQMDKLNIDHIGSNELKMLVHQTFDLFIKRTRYVQVFNWVNQILAETKNKEGESTKSSSLSVNKALVTKFENSPYLKKNN